MPAQPCSSFARALKEIVRQSPDVILIGELRDAETMRVAMSAESMRSIFRLPDRKDSTTSGQVMVWPPAEMNTRSSPTTLLRESRSPSSKALMRA